jgi:antitoxin HicB
MLLFVRPVLAFVPLNLADPTVVPGSDRRCHTIVALKLSKADDDRCATVTIALQPRRCGNRFLSGALTHEATVEYPRMMKQYTVSDGKLVLTLQEAEEGGYVVTSPLDPQLITEAETVAEAFENARDALAALAASRRKLFRKLAGVKA